MLNLEKFTEELPDYRERRPKDADARINYMKGVDRQFFAKEDAGQFALGSLRREDFMGTLLETFPEETLENTELWYVLNREPVPQDGSITYFDLDGMYSIEAFFSRWDRERKKEESREADRRFEESERREFARKLLDHFGQDALEGHTLWYTLLRKTPPNDMSVTEEDLPGEYSIQKFLDQLAEKLKQLHERGTVV